MEWYVAVHRAPLHKTGSATWQFQGQPIDTLQLNGSDLTLPLPVTFEEVVTTLEAWDCMLIEPDGSIVWASPDWRIDVQLQDGRDGLQYVEVRTTAPRAEIEKLLTAFGREPLVIQLIHDGVFLRTSTWLSLLN